MNNKNNIENQIKSQLERRELSVSGNAWDNLTKMMDNPYLVKRENKKIQFKWWWLAAAASVALVLGILFVNPSQEKMNVTPEVVQKESNSTKSSSDEINSESQTEIVHDNKNQLVGNEVESTLIQQKSKEEKVESEKLKLPIENLNKSQNQTVQQEFIAQTFPTVKEVEEIQKEIIAVNVDTISNPVKKKKNYVNADMLLYSVENNEAISETKSNSRLVIIDFNK